MSRDSDSQSTGNKAMLLLLSTNVSLLGKAFTGQVSAGQRMKVSRIFVSKRTVTYLHTLIVELMHKHLWIIILANVQQPPLEGTYLCIITSRVSRAI